MQTAVVLEALGVGLVLFLERRINSHLQNVGKYTYKVDYIEIVFRFGGVHG